MNVISLNTLLFLNIPSWKNFIFHHLVTKGYLGFGGVFFVGASFNISLILLLLTRFLLVYQVTINLNDEICNFGLQSTNNASSLHLGEVWVLHVSRLTFIEMFTAVIT